MIRMKLPDGSERYVVSGIRLDDVARTIDPLLGASAACASVDGELHDMRDCVKRDCQLTIHTVTTPEGARVAGHTAAHIVAQAVKQLFPAAVLGRGPANGNGFYHEFDIGRLLIEDDLRRIEEEIAHIIAEDLPIERREMSKGDARSLLIRRGEVLKLEVLEWIDAPVVTVYGHGEHVDLCCGPHLSSTGRLSHVSLSGVAVSNWRDDPNAESLNRIYGTAVSGG